MDLSIERPRKRRAINACTSCRASKVKGNGQRPCQRCERNDFECQYFDGVKDANVLRIEKLEEEVERLKMTVNAAGTPVPASSSSMNPIFLETDPITGASTALASDQVPLTLSTSVAAHAILSPPNLYLTAVQKGFITWEQALFYFQRDFAFSELYTNFFSGSHYLVPIFCLKTDTIQSILSRSAFLFDSIVTVECRAEEGSNSPIYHRLSSGLREHLTHVLIHVTAPSIETVQALAVRAAYSDEGLIHIALALRFAVQIGLPNAVERLVASSSSHGTCASIVEDGKELYRLVRVWHGICNLELFFSLDGGKLPGIALSTSSRRIRLLVNHPERTTVDIRLLSQVELNMIRANAYTIIAKQHSNPNTSISSEAHLRSIVQDTTVELSLWLDEWISILSSKMNDRYERELALLNLRVQYNWALMTLHLKALSNSGFENIAIVTDFERDMVRVAKKAAVVHLHHLLENPSSPTSSPPGTVPPPRYFSGFKRTMDYVWAKCAFSVLLVLKLSLLLRDSLPTVLLLLQNAYAVLKELTKVTVGYSGNISYLRILQTSIEKCEGALREHMEREQQLCHNEGSGDRGGDGQAEDDFQGYAPSEFVFEWDFPGLNLRHVPLGWQDLFDDFDRVF